MTSATVTSKGQITIPASVRHALHIQTGDKVEFVEVDHGRFEVIASTSSITKLKGMIKSDIKLTIEEMNSAIEKEACK